MGLVLSRYENQAVVIGEDITVTVMKIRGNKVVLHVVAPKSTPVHRVEVFARIHPQPQEQGEHEQKDRRTA